ncbi:hypothetical protein LTR20_006213 [Exophiala xenobiotica]|nr:hypothetical protein LTR41_007206 [Exophiala xenobiotica]KAK5369487.1 hypothetical protein LTS13_007210 [Exophiala xenobiotica]KAK5395814.1 hypothetical protein LTR79_006567 [Exophiala xenobiotica]KAK5409676.1 hypothetical protein LTR90_008865 [Exophiala xenobiotica]KAK5462263.1 hypothetical protein LTR20_006213 [Exophiala xenobiotica]
MLTQALHAVELGAAIQGALRLAVLIGLLLGATRLARNIYLAHRQPKHLRRLGLFNSSNLADQCDAKYDKPEDDSSGQTILIKALYIYPIKSCAPIELERALLTKTGFAYDRCFALAVEVNSGEWQFISQRTKPQMALIKQELWLPHPNGGQSDQLAQAGGCLIVSFPDPETPGLAKRLGSMFETWTLSARPTVRFTVPLIPTSAHMAPISPELKNFTIHSRQAAGLDLGQLPAVAAALPRLKRFLRIPERQNLTLMRCTPDTLVRTTRNLAPLKHIGTHAVHGYTDQQPVHIINLPSVHATSQLLPPENQPLNAMRFRANIYCVGAPAFSEEKWKRYRILPNALQQGSGLRANVAPTLSVVCRTSRCTMPNVIPDKGVFEADIPAPDRKKGKPQPSTTLVKYRTVESGNPAALGYLGMHCVPEDSGFEEAVAQGAQLHVEIGDEIEVLETGSHLYGSTGDDY